MLFWNTLSLEVFPEKLVLDDILIVTNIGAPLHTVLWLWKLYLHLLGTGDNIICEVRYGAGIMPKLQ